MTEFANPDSRKLAGFDVWVEKWENFKLPILIFCSFCFAICQELVKKIIYQKKVAVTNHPSKLNLSKVNGTDSIPSCE